MRRQKGMKPMENITLTQIKDFVIVLGVLLGAIVLIGNAARTWREWKRPADEFAQWRQDVDTKLDNDNKRLKAMEDGNKVVCRGILALLSHEINGNSIDKLKDSQHEMTDYLIER